MISKNTWPAIIICATVLASCDGFKSLTLHNKSGQPVTVTTKPSIPHFNPFEQSDTIHSSLLGEYKILPDSSLKLMEDFTGLTFNLKIKEEELPIDYLKIVSSKDTIVARNRKEIISLIKDKKTKYRRKTDKHFAYGNKNLASIIIRD